MKVTEHIERAINPLFSYEIVPPPRGGSAKPIVDIVKKLVPFNPPWIDVTSHTASAFYKEKADGTVERRIYKKRPGTIGICGIIQNRFKIDTVTHLLCQGFTQEETEDALIELSYLGIHNVLALRGDGPNYSKTVSANRSVNHYAIDLVKQIKRIKNGQFIEDISNAEKLDFCTGVAAYPEKHFEAPNLKMDIQHLKQKVDAGAEYITTQMFFDNAHYFNFVDQCRKAGINVPIIPGIKILKNYRQLATIPRNFYINFPDELVEEVSATPDHAQEIGIRWTMKQVEGLLQAKSPVIHFYIMNDCGAVLDVVKKFQQ